MVDIPQTTQGSPNVVKIDSVNVSLLKAMGPVINVGDIINLLVRQNQPGEQGLLAYQGNLIPATLPEFLQSGDKIAAKVLHQGEQIIFKIVDYQKLSQLTGNKETEQITKQLKTLFSSLNSGQIQLPNEPQSPPKPEGVKISYDEKAVQSIVDNIASKVPNAETLTDAKNTSTFLQAASSGSMAQNLKAVAQSLRELIGEYSPSNAQKFLELIRNELLRLDDPQTRETISGFKLISQLTEALKRENSPTLDPKNKDSSLLAGILNDLSQAQSSPDTIRNILESIADKLAQLPQNSKVLDSKSLTDLQNLSNRLDNLAQSQETLSQLNPLMNAMGEPALILFPFIFQGLLNHSKIYIEADDRVHRKNKDDTKQNEESGTDGPYQRVQVSVPLPTLGTVDVDIAHRSKEILVRFTVEDHEVGQFILEQLEGLASILREQGFDQAELVANVSKTRSLKPLAGITIGSSTSIVV